MKPEEIFRLSDMDREGFLKILSSSEEYSKAYLIRNIDATKG